MGSGMSRVRAAGAYVSRVLASREVDVSPSEAESAVLEAAIVIFNSFEAKDGATLGSVLKYAKLRAIKVLTSMFTRAQPCDDLSGAPSPSPNDDLDSFCLDEFLASLSPFDKWVIESRIAGAAWISIADAVCRNEGKRYFPSAATKLKRRVIGRICPLLMQFFSGADQQRLLNLLSGVVGDGHTVGRRRALSREEVTDLLGKLPRLSAFDKWAINSRMEGHSWKDIATAANETDVGAFKSRLVSRLRKVFRKSISVKRSLAARLLDTILRE